MRAERRRGAAAVRFVAAAAMLGAALAGLRAFVFVPEPARWNRPSVELHLSLPPGGPLLDGSPDLTAVAVAGAEEWNRHLRDFRMEPVPRSNAARLSGNGINNVFFSATIFGQSFEGALAVTTFITSGGRRFESDVLFNSAYRWDAYRGPIRFSGGEPVFDFRRVALHEFGHVLGLDHPDQAGQTVAALMNSRVSGVDRLLFDDIRGGQALYGAGTSGPFGIVRRPVRSVLATRAGSYVLRGKADGFRGVTAVDLRLRRYPGRRFRASGIDAWRRRVPLRPGWNRIVVFAELGPEHRDRIEIIRIRRLRE